LAKDLWSPNNPTIWEHTVKDRHQFVMAQTIVGRVERFAPYVLESKAPLPVPALKPPHFKTAVRARSIEKNFELPVGHLI